MRNVDGRRADFLANKKREVSEIVDEVEEVGDVVGDTRGGGVLVLQVLFVDAADAFEALVEALVVGVASGLRAKARLDEHDGVIVDTHVSNSGRG